MWAASGVVRLVDFELFQHMFARKREVRECPCLVLPFQHAFRQVWNFVDFAVEGEGTSNDHQWDYLAISESSEADLGGDI